MSASAAIPCAATLGKKTMSRKIFTTLRDTFSDIAQRKTEASKARREGTPENVEHSSVVYAVNGREDLRS